MWRRDDVAPADTTGAPGPTRVEVTAVDFAFEDVPETLGAGETTFVLTNAGEVPHEMAFGRLLGDTTIEDAVAPGDSNGVEEGSRRVIESVEPDASGEVTFELKPGRYGYVCFLGEGTNDEPHALHGMLGEFVVE